MYYQTINYALQNFKVLQMTLFSRIFKILDSYMETLYRIPNFKCTYLKTCYLYCIYKKNYEAHKTSHVETYRVPFEPSN